MGARRLALAGGAFVCLRGDRPFFQEGSLRANGAAGLSLADHAGHRQRRVRNRGRGGPVDFATAPLGGLGIDRVAHRGFSGEHLHGTASGTMRIRTVVVMDAAAAASGHHRLDMVRRAAPSGEIRVMILFRTMTALCRVAAPGMNE